MHRMVEADFDAAEDLRELVEAIQVDLGEVVDVHPGQLLHRGHGGGPACLVAQEGQLVLAHGRVLGAELLLLVEHAHAVGLVDLADLLRAHRAGEMDPVVARNGETGRFPAVGGHVDQDEGIRVIPAGAVGDGLPVSGVQRPQDVAGQDVPVPVPAAFQAHQQDVLGAGGRAAANGVRGADAAHVTHDIEGHATGQHGQRRSDAGHGVPGPAGAGGPRCSPGHRILPAGFGIPAAKAIQHGQRHRKQWLTSMTSMGDPRWHDQVARPPYDGGPQPYWRPPEADPGARRPGDGPRGDGRPDDGPWGDGRRSDGRPDDGRRSDRPDDAGRPPRAAGRRGGARCPPGRGSSW